MSRGKNALGDFIVQGKEGLRVCSQLGLNSKFLGFPLFQPQCSSTGPQNPGARPYGQLKKIFPLDGRCDDPAGFIEAGQFGDFLLGLGEELGISERPGYSPADGQETFPFVISKSPRLNVVEEKDSIRKAIIGDGYEGQARGIGYLRHHPLHVATRSIISLKK